MVQIFPESVGKLWNEWNLRVMIVSSLCLQIVLIVFGSRRKYIAKNWVRILVWMTYLSADWVAAVALGMISNFQPDDQENSSHPNSMMIITFWAPFLLVHLGGPDTITAYSLEDNELWLRHLLGLLVQVGVALYVFLRSWTGITYSLSLLAIPMFVAGIIKYAERTWVLWSASSERFRDKLLPPPNPGRDSYADMAAEFSAIKARGEEVGISTTGTEGLRTVGFGVNPSIPEAKHLHEAYKLFNIFARLYADLLLDYHDLTCCNLMLQDHSSEDILKIIEVELGFMYDVLYTKANIVYSFTGIIFRSICLLCYLSTFLVFCLVINKKIYFTIDVILTYLLSIGAIALELYATVVLVFTDWTLYWLSKQTHPLACPMYRTISALRSNLSYEKRWSKTMTQYNLIDFCLKEKPLMCAGIQRLLGTYDMSEKYWYTTLEDVPIKMKQLIFEQLKDAQEGGTQKDHDVRQVLTWRGNHVLQKKNCIEKFKWSVVDVPFDKSILLWHIATDLCYHTDLDKYPDVSVSPDSKPQLSKLFANYMMHILVMRPFMLPKGIGQIRFRDTCAEATTFFDKRRSVLGTNGKGNARQVLLEVNTELDPEGVIGDRSKTVLFAGCRLAKQLQLLETQEGWDYEDKWGMMTEVWIEMLCYAVSQCEWNHHAQQLRRGGELLTHVCLLMAHYGLSEQFQIARGSPRIRIQAIRQQSA